MCKNSINISYNYYYLFNGFWIFQMKFCNVHPTAYHLKCVKGKRNTFFPLAIFTWSYGFRDNDCVHVLLTACSTPCPIHIVQAVAQRRGNEREWECPSHPQSTESESFRFGKDWETIWSQGFLQLLQWVHSHVSVVVFPHFWISVLKFS